jgi:hypothetical protein
MKRIYNIKLILLLVISIFGFQACFDLEEETFNLVDKSVYYKNKTSVESIIADIYMEAQDLEEFALNLQECTADQCIPRVWNGGAWGYDGGYRHPLTIHDWNASAVAIRAAWEVGFGTIGRCNNAIDDFTSINYTDIGITKEEMDSFIAEVRTIRAWMYYQMFEYYGGTIPIATTLDMKSLPAPPSDDFDESCQIIWDFIIQELDESLDDLPENVKNRMSKAANRVIKVRLLLNSELFTGKAKYEECAALCQRIIDGDYGNYQLATDYTRIYSYDNETCQEIIFAISYDPNYHYSMHHKGSGFLPYYLSRTYFGGTPPLGDEVYYNLFILAPSKDNSANILEGGTPKSFVFDYGDKLGAVLDRMNDNDIRKQNYVYDVNTDQWSGYILNGPMYANFGTGNPVPADADRAGQHLVFVDQVGTFQNLGRDLEVVMTPRWGETNSGARLMKYPIYPASTGIYYTEGDFVHFRLAEVYYTLAECRLRLGNPGEAKNLVNLVRRRYFSDADWVNDENYFPGFTSIDEDWMLSQWGLEFLFEGHRRRTDLRRFDKFTQGQWWHFGRASDLVGSSIVPEKRDRKYEWFPVPEDVLTANPKLKQNPYY